VGLYQGVYVCVIGLADLEKVVEILNISQLDIPELSSFRVGAIFWQIVIRTCLTSYSVDSFGKAGEQLNQSMK
jgi:hypothetical protein